MKHYVLVTWPARIRKAWPIFSVLLLPVMACEVGSRTSAATTEQDFIPLGTTEPSRPYLQYVGPPALRFEDAPPPPDLPDHPVAGTTSPPGHISDSAKVKPNAEAPAMVAAVPAPAGASGSEPTSQHPSESAEASASQATSILPDDSKQRVRPEDFLPFFQFPGGSTAPVANAPGTIPPSSATYKQQ